MESNSKVPETTRCPTCGWTAVLTHWSVPEGLAPNLRRYECLKRTCRTVVFIQMPVSDTGLVTQGPDIFHSGEVIA